jgi:hypothetical protein
MRHTFQHSPILCRKAGRFVQDVFIISVIDSQIDKLHLTEAGYEGRFRSLFLDFTRLQMCRPGGTSPVTGRAGPHAC